MDKSHRGVWRRYPRVIPELPRPVVAELAGVGECRVNDISEGGAELDWPDSSTPEVGALLHLDLVLPLSEPYRMHATARVRHAEPGRIGVAFAEIGASERDCLADYLRRERRERSLGKRLRRWYQALLDEVPEGKAHHSQRSPSAAAPNRRAQAAAPSGNTSNRL